MEHLTKLESVLLASELEIAGDEDEHAAAGSGRLAIDGGNGMLALLEGEGREFGDDALGALNLLPFEILSQGNLSLLEMQNSHQTSLLFL